MWQYSLMFSFMTFFMHVGPSLLRVIYRNTGDCYTTEDNVSSSFTQLLLPNCMVQAEARPHEPLLSHRRTMMSRTSREQINRAAAILGLHQPWHAWNRGKYSPLSLWLLHSFCPSFHDGPWALEGMVFYLEPAFFSVLSSCDYPTRSLPAEPALCCLWGVSSMSHPDNCQHHPTPCQNTCLPPCVSPRAPVSLLFRTLYSPAPSLPRAKQESNGAKTTQLTLFSGFILAPQLHCTTQGLEFHCALLFFSF